MYKDTEDGAAIRTISDKAFSTSLNRKTQIHVEGEHVTNGLYRSDIKGTVSRFIMDKRSHSALALTSSFTASHLVMNEKHPPVSFSHLASFIVDLTAALAPGSHTSEAAEGLLDISKPSYPFH